MANEELTEPPTGEKRIWPPRTMDDLSPADRAQQMRFAEKLKALQGKIHLDIDLDELRGRNRWPEFRGWIEGVPQGASHG